MKASLTLTVDEAYCEGDNPQFATVFLHGTGAVNVRARISRKDLIVWMVSAQDWLRGTQDRSLEHFVAEITHIASPGPDVEVTRIP